MICRPPHTPGCVGAPYLHVTFSRRVARRPKPGRIQTQKKAQGPRNPPEARLRRPEATWRRPEAPQKAPKGTLQPPGGPPKARGRPPEASKTPQNPAAAKTRKPRRPPDGFGAPKATTGKAHNLSGRSRKGIEVLETRPWIKARQIRGSGNLGRQPETRKGIKGGCLRKQRGWEK